MTMGPDREVQEVALIWLLRLGGALTLTALAAVFLPVTWMSATHEWLGMGAFPASPLVDYLTRSIALMYAVHGGILILASTDVRRYRPIVRYVALVNLVFGVLVLGIDLHAGMPTFWTLGEGPPLALTGLVMLGLVRAVPGR